MNYYAYGRNKYEVGFTSTKELLIDCRGSSFSKISVEYIDDFELRKEFSVQTVNTDDIVYKAKEYGYDTVIFKNIFDVNLTTQTALLHPKDQVVSIKQIMM